VAGLGDCAGANFDVPVFQAAGGFGGRAGDFGGAAGCGLGRGLGHSHDGQGQQCDGHDDDYGFHGSSFLG